MSIVFSLGGPCCNLHEDVLENFNANVPSIKPPQTSAMFQKKTPPFFDVGGVFVVFLFREQF